MREFWLSCLITSAVMLAMVYSGLSDRLPEWAWPWGLIPFFWLVFFVLAWFGGKRASAKTSTE